MQTPITTEELHPRGSLFEPLIDLGTAAGLLRIHPKTLQRMARAGEVPAARVGRYWRFRASELDSCIRSQVSSSGQPCPSESRF
jgi:excisionase family DNA binding protein